MTAAPYEKEFIGHCTPRMQRALANAVHRADVHGVTLDLEGLIYGLVLKATEAYRDTWADHDGEYRMKTTP